MNPSVAVGKKASTPDHGAGSIEPLSSDRNLRRERERLRIEKAALKLLLERGFDDVTAEDIAEAAEISRRTFFRYFPSRDEVLSGVYLRALLHLFDLLRARPLDEPLVEALVNAARIDMVLATDPDELEIAELTRQLMARDGEAWRRAVGQAQNAILDGYTNVVSYRLRTAGRDPAGARLIAASLWAVSCEVFFQWLQSGDRRRLPDLLLEGLHTVGEALACSPHRGTETV